MKFGLIQKLFIIGSILLFIQFLLGMIINLFVKIPNNNSLNFLPVEVNVHIALGVLILILGLVILGAYMAAEIYNSLIVVVASFTQSWFNIKQPSSKFSNLFILAILFTALAILSGIYFILRGLDDSLSLVMAISFISIYTIYFFEFYRIGME